MKKMFLASGILLALCVVGFAQAPTAKVKGAAEQYILTFEKFELQKQDDTWVTVKDGDTDVDITDLAEGAAQDIMGNQIPVGVYKAFKSTVSSRIYIKGAVEYGDDIYYTTAQVWYNIQAPMGSPGTGEPGEAIVCGVTDGYADLPAFYAAPPGNYNGAWIRPPDMPESHGEPIYEDFEVVEGAVEDVELESDVSEALQLWQASDVGAWATNVYWMWPGIPDISEKDDGDPI